MELDKTVIYQFDMNYNLVKTWNSIDEIVESNPVFQRKLLNACLTKRFKSSLNYRWSYTPLEKPNVKLIYQYDMDYNFIKTWNCIGEILENPTMKYGCIYVSLTVPNRSAYNYRWSFTPLEKPDIKYIYQYNLKYELQKEWESIKEILENNPSFKRENIVKCLNVENKRKHRSAHGYIWSYIQNLKWDLHSLLNFSENSKNRTSNCKKVKKIIIHENLIIFINNFLDRSDYNYKDDNIEYWKDIDNHEDNYKISNFGNVYSKHHNRLIFLYENIYYKVYLQKNNYSVHILVAKHFVQKFNAEYNIVNHIDENKLNNHYKNLEWTTYQGNSIAYQENRKKRAIREIIQYDLDGNVIKEWKNVYDIIEQNKTYNRKHLLICINRENKAYNYKWVLENNHIFQYDYDDNFIKEWNNINEINTYNPKFNKNQLTKVIFCAHRVYGYIWKYKNIIQKPSTEINPDEEFKRLGIIDGKDFSNYQVSNYGNIKGKKDNLFIKSTSTGYETAALTSKEGIVTPFRVHRLVALLWVPNNDIEINIIVNHIDENKLNNHYKNLEWVTYKQNSIHSTGIKIHKIDKNTDEIIGTFNSITEAAESCGKKIIGTIINVCKNNRKTAYGYKWKYA